MTKLKSILACSALALLAAGTASASILDVTGDPTFVSFHGGGTGTYGLETRGGRDGAQDWEIGVGSQTSNSGTFAQGEFTWTTGTLVSFAYDYGVTEANKATVTIGSTSVSYDFGTLLLGNAIQITAKRNARLLLTEIDGHTVDIDVDNTGAFAGSSQFSTTKLFSSSSFLDGFTMTGQIMVQNGGRSAHQVLVTAGNVAPIPVPPALALGALALGGLALYGRRQRRSA